MIREELVSVVAEQTGETKKTVSSVLKGLTTAIREEVKKGGKVQLKEFGVFSHAKRSAREGINPTTKEKIQIPEKEVCKFKPSSNFFQ